MLTAILEIVLLLCMLLLPLIPVKKKKQATFKIDTDTSDATYAINEGGRLEEIRKVSTMHL